MGQARVYEPETIVHAEAFRKAGFRWCNKDCRWERNCKNPSQVLEALKSELPDIKTEAKE